MWQVRPRQDERGRRRALLALAVLGAVGSSAGSGIPGQGVSLARAAGPQASAWPMFHRNALHEANTTVALAANPGILWSAPLAGAAEYSSPVIDLGGNVYIGDLGERLSKFDASGNLVWSFDTAGNLRRSSPAIADDGTVYIGASDGTLYAVRANGTQKWTYQADGAIKTGVTIGNDGSVYFGADDGRVYSVSALGALEWSYATGDTVRSTPAVLDDALIAFGSNDGGIYALNSAGGLVWNGFTGGPVKAGISFGQGGDLIVPSQDGFLYSLSASGSLEWSVLTSNTLRCTAAIGATGKVYVPVDEELHCYRDDGAVSYTVTLGGRIFASPTVATDPADGSETVIIGAEDGNLYGIRLGEILWTVPIGAPIYSSAALDADGTIYVGANDGRLYAVGGNPTDAPELVLDPPMEVRGANPARRGDLLSFRLPVGGEGTVAILDAAGRTVQALATRDGEAAWVAGTAPDRDVPAGVYFFHWTSESRTGAGRIVVVR